MRTIMLAAALATAALAPRAAEANCEGCENTDYNYPETPPGLEGGNGYDYYEYAVTCNDVPTSAEWIEQSDLGIEIASVHEDNCTTFPIGLPKWKMTAQIAGQIQAAAKAIEKDEGEAGATISVTIAVSEDFECPNQSSATLPPCKGISVTPAVGALIHYKVKRKKRYVTYTSYYWEDRTFRTDRLVAIASSAPAFCRNIDESSYANLTVGASCTVIETKVDCTKVGCEHCCNQTVAYQACFGGETETVCTLVPDDNAYGYATCAIALGDVQLDASCAASVCGDGVCDAGEDCAPDCLPPGVCGNLVCEWDESFTTCSDDCPTVCGDGLCEGEEPFFCTTDCG
jgi:hypothetical protein